MKRLALAALCVLWAQTAQAQSRVVVLRFEGPGAAGVRASVVRALSKTSGVESVAEKDARKAADTLHADLATAEGRVAVAHELSLSAIVEGSVKKHGASSEASIRVYNGSDGALLRELSSSARSAALARHAGQQLGDELGATVAKGHPPAAAPAPAPEREREPEPEPAPRAVKATPLPVELEAEREPEPEPGSWPRVFEAGLGVRLLTRSYSYNQALLPMSEHSLQATPALRIEARWYPAARMTHGFASNLGLELQGQMMWPVDAKKGSATFNTTSLGFWLGARVRIPIRDHELGLLAGYGGHSLQIADHGGQDPGIPSVAYGFARLGADGRIALSRPVSLGVRAAYLLLVSYGELAKSAWFSHASGGGLEAELSLRYSVTELLAIDLGGGMMRYFLSLQPSPTDGSVTSNGRIAGGVVDQYFYGTLGLALRL